ncbi:MAG: FAD-dependent oxidoreductase [Rhodobacteraceae bacterium]|nr:MAG: FAD-dependent oxidoreductase [Paracoccaceae bacterium]
MPYAPPPKGRGARAGRVPVAIVGAGPVGLSAAIDLALKGVASVVVDDDDRVSPGSRAFTWARRTIDIFDRLGVGEAIRAKGVTWRTERVFHGARTLAVIDHAPDAGVAAPAFLNLQQYHVEEILLARCADFPDLIDLRFRHRVTAAEQDAAGVTLDVYTEDGRYRLAADWLLACDGARSSVRGMMDLAFEGEAFEDRFLIADIRSPAPFPDERWFWFAPTFHPGQTAMLHRQPDGMVRLDLQLGPDADPERERLPERVAPRVEAALGGRPFDLDWVSVYAFSARRLAQFVHGRIVFAGDSAHVIPPFGSRGANAGVQDVDNLCWKLALVIGGAAGPELLASYDAERGRAADDNLRRAGRSARFMGPRTPAERLFRDEVLALAVDHAFAQRLIDPGRMSTPCALDGLSLQSADDPAMAGPMGPGAPCLDAPVTDPDGRPGWLLPRLGGRFTLLGVGVEPPAVEGAARLTVGEGGLGDPAGLVAARYPRGVYIIRPDQHVAARWAAPAPRAAAHALARARGAIAEVGP